MLVCFIKMLALIAKMGNMDNWNLKKLFTFSEDIIKIYNDSNEIKQYFDKSGKKHNIKPNNTLTLGKATKNFKIPNNDKLKLSDKSVLFSSFDSNLTEIIKKYTEVSRKVNLVDLKNFLEYHLKNCNQKNRFIEFVKYIFRTKIWIVPEKRNQFIENDNFIDDWIEKKQKQIKQKKALFIAIPFLIMLIIGMIFIEEYRAMIIGAIIAIFSAQLSKLIENLFN
ncbi:MAG: hypothetical protein IMY72_01875 [Bacteroidetes bacterium]|nr:hypothetical protein [Bacteroidota bacterium]